MTQNLTKITVPLPTGNLAGADTESMWAEVDRPGIYRIKNIPFFARGFSRDDLVLASLTDGALIYTRPAQHNGHSTYQVYVKGSRASPGIVSLTAQLAAMRCDIEFATDHFFSVDVHPQADIYAVYAELERAEAAGVIDFQEGHCGHAVGSAPAP